MPKRNRRASDEKVRITFAEVYRSGHQDLITKGVLVKEDTYRPATQEEISDSFALVQKAEEEGDWIDVKKEVAIGEWRKMSMTDPISIITTFLLGWSFLANDEPLSYSFLMPHDQRIAIVDSLSVGDYQELEAAVSHHFNEVMAEREALKNVTAGETNSSQTSPSLAG